MEREGVLRGTEDESDDKGLPADDSLLDKDDTNKGIEVHIPEQRWVSHFTKLYEGHSDDCETTVDTEPGEIRAAVPSWDQRVMWYRGGVQCGGPLPTTPRPPQPTDIDLASLDQCEGKFYTHGKHLGYSQKWALVAGFERALFMSGVEPVQRTPFSSLGFAAANQRLQKKKS
ncbi:hypothetical protein NDU88_008565 [Pleurodeles waltl]|uniref:Uncharacterized protein n=1 Tax=Pleurodeles waltl TaxID=8319 RepID=A0AAV7N987_PLEWA|nr:hypothetical protein NDU88_008565 [Pleurodeles waltl]